MAKQKKDIKLAHGYLVRVQKTEYKGNEYIDIRKWYTDKETKNVKPTKKGITISPDNIDEIIEAIKNVSELY